MARRRGRFRRIKPDMGWYVSPLGTAVTTVRDPQTHVAEFMAFAEIDGDEGIIAQDKSDWFIKRLIVEGFFFLQPSTTASPADCIRVLPWMFFTARAADADDMVTNDWQVHEPDGWDSARRVIRTGVSPVYVPFHPVQELNIGNQGALSTEAAGSITVAGRTVAAPYWGPSRIDFDVPVSSAGLVPDSSLYMAWSMGSDIGPGLYDWTVGDAVGFWGALRVLLQKRIG